MPGKLARPVRRGAARKRTRELREPRRAAYPTERPAGAPASELPAPSARVVAASDLDAMLPDGTPRVTPARRRGILDERLRQVTRLQRS